jgi:hypothetical protein
MNMPMACESGVAARPGSAQANTPRDTSSADAAVLFRFGIFLLSPENRLLFACIYTILCLYKRARAMKNAQSQSVSCFFASMRLRLKPNIFNPTGDIQIKHPFVNHFRRVSAGYPENASLGPLTNQ